MQTAAAIARTADPRKRLTAAAALKRRADRMAEPLRLERDMAICVAHLDQGVPPVDLYKPLGYSRGLLVRIIQRAPAQRPTIPDARDKAIATSAEVQRLERVAEDAVKLRDETAILLIFGGDDPVTGKPVEKISAADVARATELTTARIAQIVDTYLVSTGARAGKPKGKPGRPKATARQ